LDTAVTQVVILNGVGSAGKTAIAKALQGMVKELFLHVAMDSFLDMLPTHSFGTSEGLTFRPALVDGEPIVDIDSGEFATLTFRGMRRSVAAMADLGLNLVVDEVATADVIHEYRELLAGRTHAVVGVMAPLPVLEARERQRGDRMIGLARAQYSAIHQGIDYDLTIDTGDRTPHECAAYIADRLGLSRIA
jgi:chloramphenicol 3-O phosphotransferase